MRVIDFSLTEKDEKGKAIIDVKYLNQILK